VRSLPEREDPARRADVAALAAGLLLGGVLFLAGLGSPQAPARECFGARALPTVDGVARVACGPRAMPGSRAFHGVPVSGPVALLFGRSIDVNTASAESLLVLPGIGPSRARAITEARAAGAFASVADLRRVPGIGPRTVAGLQGWIRVAGPVRAHPVPAR
jgi:competence ComEA-like helix-hairpin-helix protein